MKKNKTNEKRKRKKKNKNLCTDLVADIKMQVVRARARSLARADVGVLWPTALCVPRSRHYFSV